MGLFTEHAAPVEAVYGAGDAIAAHAGDVENLNGTVDGAHAVARDGVAGMLDGPMASAPAASRLRAFAVAQGSLLAGAAVRLFGNHVAVYNAGIAELNTQWETAAADDFGAQRWDLPTGAVPEDQAAATAAFADEKAANQAALRVELTARQQQLEADVDAGAAEVAWLLAAGGTDATLVHLYEAGALPATAAGAFPGSDYVAEANPVARWWNLVASGVIPPELWEMSASEVHDYLLLNPESAATLIPELGMLLAFGSLNAQELVFLDALGRYDGDTVNRTVGGMPPSSDSLDQIGHATSRLRDINSRLAGGGTLTDGDREYLHAWYNAVGADDLAALPDHVNQAIHNDMMLGVSQADEDEYIQRLRDRYLTPVADGIMNLSNPDVGGTDRLENMPQAIQDLAATEVGTTTGIRTFDIDGEEQAIPGVGELDVTIMNLDRFVGFADLMSASNVLGGDQFTSELGQHAIHIKQQLNEIAHFNGLTFDALLDDMWDNDSENGTYAPDPLIIRAAEGDLHTLLDHGDTGVSTMLSVVGRNSDASAALLLDPADRVTMLGESWSSVDIDSRPFLLGDDWLDPSGAAGVIRAGTDRYGSDGQSSTELQAHAAVEVFLEVGRDRDIYLERMSEEVSDAVVDVGIDWIDTFARTPVATDADEVDLDGWVKMLAVPGYADRERAISLTSDAQRLFLEFVAGTGTANADDGATRFGVAVEANSVKWIADALRTGDTNSVNHAVRSAATLDGSFVGATYEYSLDQEHGRLEAAQAAAAAKQQQVALFSNLALGGSTSAAWATLLGSPASTASKNIGSALISIAVSGGYRGIDQLTGLNEPAPIVSEIDAESGRIFEENTQAAPGSRDYTLLLAAQAAGNDPTQGISNEVMAQQIASLYQRDGDTVQRNEFDVPQLRPYDELLYEEGRGGTNIDDLWTAVDYTYGDVADLSQYDDVWETYNSTEYYDRPVAQQSQWSDDDTAFALEHGSAAA